MTIAMCRSARLAAVAACIVSLLAAPALQARIAPQAADSGGLDAVARQQANFALECVGIYDLAIAKAGGDSTQIAALSQMRQASDAAFLQYSGMSGDDVTALYVQEDKAVSDGIAAGNGKLDDIEGQCSQMFGDDEDLADLSSLDDSSSSSSSSSPDDSDWSGLDDWATNIGLNSADDALTCVGVYDYAIAKGGDAASLADLEASRGDAAALYDGFAAKTRDEAAADYPGADATVAATIDGGKDTLPSMQATCDQMLVDMAGAA